MSNWISPNRALTEEEMQTNAAIIYAWFGGIGFVDESVAAMLGNFQVESSVNPGRWQAGFQPEQKGAGYGLPQFTPWTKYSQWAGKYWKTDHDLQLARIEFEYRNGGQWIAKLPVTFEQFAHNTGNWSVAYLAEVWCTNYERPGVPHLDRRIEAANYWYKWITGELPGETPPPPPEHKDPEKYKGVWLWLLFKLRERRDFTKRRDLY